MPDGFFTASLSTGIRPATTVQPMLLRLQPTTARRERSSGTPIPYVGQADPAPGSPQAWLQVWEIDTFETHGHRSRRRTHDGEDEETPPESNDFLCAIPGFVKQTGPHAFEFRVIPGQEIAWGSGDPLGFVSLKLKQPDGTDWLQDGRNLVIPIRGEGEDEVDLGVCLATSASARDHASEWQGGGLFHATNLTHMLQGQLHEGGLLLAFFADLLTPGERRDLSSARRHIRDNHLTGEALQEFMGSALTSEEPLRLIWDSRNTDCPGNNDTFCSIGETFERSHHSIGLSAESRELFLECTPMQGGIDDVIGTIQQVVAKTNEQFVQRFAANDGHEAKVKHLVFFTHGWSRGIKVGRGGARFEIPQIDRFVQQVGPLLTDDVLVSLMACSTGGGDETFGAPAAPGHRYPGEGSFADRLCRALIAAGRSNAAVWAHTTAGHATGNPNLRAFAAAGSADAVWMTTSPPSDLGQRAGMAGQFVASRSVRGDDGEQHARENFRLALGHPGDRVQRVMDASPAPAATE